MMAFLRVFEGTRRRGDSAATPVIFIYSRPPAELTFEGSFLELVTQLREAFAALQNMYIFYDRMNDELMVAFDKSVKDDVRSIVETLAPELRDELLPGFI